MSVQKPTLVWENIADYSASNVNKLQSSAPDVDKGYDIEAVRRTAERTAQIMSTANGVLFHPQGRMRFFVNAIAISIGMGNTRAQGRRVQDLYPRSFNMPTYTIKGQSLTQEDYGLLCEFVHDHQQKAVGSGATLGLWVKEGIPFEGLRPEWFTGGIAGYHKPIEAQGFVLSMPRAHKRFEYTPKFEFEFSVVQQSAGIFGGQAISPSELMNPEITEIIEKHEKPFSQVPLTGVTTTGSTPAPPKKEETTLPGSPGPLAPKTPEEENLLELTGNELTPQPPKPAQKR